MYQVGNIYVIAAVAVIGGGLFGEHLLLHQMSNQTIN